MGFPKKIEQVLNIFSRQLFCPLTSASACCYDFLAYLSEGIEPRKGALLCIKVSLLEEGYDLIGFKF